MKICKNCKHLTEPDFDTDGNAEGPWMCSHHKADRSSPQQTVAMDESELDDEGCVNWKKNDRKETKGGETIAKTERNNSESNGSSEGDAKGSAGVVGKEGESGSVSLSVYDPNARTKAAAPDEANSAAGASETTDESQGDAEQPDTAKEETAAHSEPVAVNDAGTDDIDELRKELDIYKTYCEEIAQRRTEIAKAEATAKRTKQKVKELEEELDEFMDKFKPYTPKSYPLFDKTATSEPTVATDAPTVDVNAWKSWSAKEHFTFSEKEWELMAPSEGMIDKMTVGDLEDFRVRLSRGEKVKGFGEAKRQKLDDAMMDFWSKHPEFGVAPAPAPASEEPDDDETDKLTDEEIAQQNAENDDDEESNEDSDEDDDDDDEFEEDEEDLEDEFGNEEEDDDDLSKY